jgi:hypothetical protein
MERPGGWPWNIFLYGSRKGLDKDQIGFKSVLGELKKASDWT